MSESCHACLGKGYVVTCFDDICTGQDECMHGDGEEDCPECGGEGCLGEEFEPEPGEVREP